METVMKTRFKIAGLFWSFAALISPLAQADTLFKCIADGKTNFTSNPQTAKGDCQPMQLNVPQPNPVDVARGMERLQEYEKHKKADEERSRKSKELDPEAQRRAQNAELAKSVARAPVPSMGSTRSRSESRKKNGG